MRLLKATIISVCVGILLSISLVTPAHAGTDSLADCSPSILCTFDQYNYGTPPQYNYNNSLNGCINIGAAWNDRISSAYNRASHDAVEFFEHANCSSGSRTVHLNSGIAWTVNGDSSLHIWPNNVFSSIYFW